jgi:iron complex outermembrane receptor protein
MKSKIGTLWAVDSRLGAGAGTCDPLTGGTNPNCINLKGNAQTYAPHLTFNFGVQYAFHLENGNTITPRLNFSHQAEQWATLFEHAQIGDHLGARNLLGAQLEWQSGSWLVTLYGTNLTNQQYVASLNSGALYAGPPRQFGIRLMKAF